MMNKVSIASAIIASIMASTGYSRDLASAVQDKLGHRSLQQESGAYERVNSVEECGATFYDLVVLNHPLNDSTDANLLSDSDGFNLQRAYITNCWE